MFTDLVGASKLLQLDSFNSIDELTKGRDQKSIAKSLEAGVSVF